MLKLVETIHAAALAPQGWDAILAQVVAHVGGRGGMLQAPTLPGRRQDPFECYVLHDLDTERVAEGMAHYTVDDPLTPGLGRDVGWDFDRVAWVYRGCDPDEFRHTPFWNDYWLKLDAGDMLSLVIDLPDDAPVQVMSIVQSARSSGFTLEQMTRFQALAPHLKFAAGLRRRAARGALPTQVDQALLELAPVACVLLDIHGRVLHANRRARALSTGVRLAGGRLETIDPSQNATLQEAIGLACQRRAGVPRSGRSLSLAAARGAVAATIAPLGDDNPLVGELSAVRAVVYLEPACVQPLAMQAQARLRSLFALTEAQAEVALALLDGCTPAEIAADRGRSRRTVEHQTSAILKRTGSRRLTDLQGLRGLLQG